MHSIESSSFIIASGRPSRFDGSQRIVAGFWIWLIDALVAVASPVARAGEVLKSDRLQATIEGQHCPAKDLMLVEVKRNLARIKRGDVQRAALQCWRTRQFPPGSTHVRVGPAFRGTLALVIDEIDMHLLRVRAGRTVIDALEGIGAHLTAPVDREPLRLTIPPGDFPRAKRQLRSLPAHWNVSVDSDMIRAIPHHVHTTGINLCDSTIAVEITTRSTLVERSRQESLPNLEIHGQSKWPIDLVYTWVDGEDPEWQNRRRRALAETERTGLPTPSSHPNALDNTRYISTNELLYSLRSVYQFANWVRRIYIVTDGQTPSWLNTDHPKIQLINHMDILPKSTFNSHAIESALHRIPGLSEHYLYLNDDVFFGKMAYPSDYFDEDGRAKFFPSELMIPQGDATIDDKPIIAAAKNGRAVFRKYFNKELTNRLKHSVHAQRKSVVEEMERELGVHFERLAQTPFRSPHDLSIASSLAHWWGQELDKAIPADTNYLYLNITDRNSRQVLDALQSLRRYDVFCLNQEESESHIDSARHDLTAFLREYFPAPAPWERTIDGNSTRLRRT